ncbi:MAG TPA: ergothioneine biosynthesis protein EgtB [Actinomycetota bacterium]
MPAATSNTPSDAALRRQLEDDLDTVRGRLGLLVAPLDDDAIHRQHDPIMSPLVWDMGHVGNFEELWLLRELDGRGAHDPTLDQVYNPFENPRWVRADLPILQRPEAVAYLADVRAEALEVLRRADLRDPGRPLLADGYVYRMITQHEAQHQETMLQTLDLRADPDPYPPVAARRLLVPRPVDDRERVQISGGEFQMGTDDRGAAYDNERPRHPVTVPSFWIDRFPVTARRFASFVAAGGYDQPEHWSAEGRAWLRETGDRAPQGWTPDGSGWKVRRFGHLLPLDPREPVQHVSFHEAEAFAHWAGGRLPTEAEWEKAAAWDPAAGRSRTWPWGETPPSPQHANVDQLAFGPAPVGSYPAGASAYGVEQLLGDVYEWTSSPFTGYPGYATFPYPEYSEVFFGDQYRVLRGASWATASWVARNTFRNWDYPKRRQLFAGLRLAWDAPPGQGLDGGRNGGGPG